MHALTLSLLLLPASTLAAFNLLNLPEIGGLPELPQGTVENPACIAAYNATIDCEVSALTNSFADPNAPTEAELDKICTSECLTSLRRWIRGGEGCEGEAYLNYFGLMSENFFDLNITTTASDVQQYYITASYHSKCLVDKTTNKYCALTPEAQGFTQPSLLNTSNPDTLCKDNSCGTQSAYLFAPLKTIYEYDPNTAEEDRRGADLPMITLEEACPGIDTSKYPLREEDVTAAMLQSGSDGKDTKPNAAVGRTISGFNVLVGVAVGLVGYLTL